MGGGGRSGLGTPVSGILGAGGGGGCYILTVGGHCLGKSAKPGAVCLPAASSSAASKKDGP